MGKGKAQQKPKTSEQVKASKDLAFERMKTRKAANASKNDAQRQSNLAIVEWLHGMHLVDKAVLEASTPSEVVRYARRHDLLAGYEE
jgi:hypothetical protein